MNIRLDPGSNEKVNGLRKPIAQIASLTSMGRVTNGLSPGIVPSLLIRSILPSRLVSTCALLPFALSPTAM